MKKFNKIFNKRLKLIVLPILALLAFVLALYIVEANYTDLLASLSVSTGMTLSSMSVIGSINRVTDKDTAGNQISAKVWLIDIDQVDDEAVFPTPNEAGEIGTIPLKTGEYMHYFMAIDDSLEDKSDGSKGDVTTTVTNSFAFVVGGHRASLFKFLEDHAGGRFIIIYQIATDKNYYVLGSDLKPMILKTFARLNGKESRSTTLTFENSSFEQPKKYVGTIVKIAPTVLAANATTIPFTAAQQYKTGTNTSATAINAFTGLSNSDINRYVEIIGTGGTNPSTIIEADGIVLKDGDTWYGRAGSSIIFRVLDSSTLVEVSRIQTA